MFAIIESGGKQYRVEPGDVLDVELLGSLAPDAEKGALVRFERVLAVGGAAAVSAGVGGAGGKETPASSAGAAGSENPAGSAAGNGAAAPRIGRPLVEGALVTASLVGEALGPKIRVFKHKRRNTQRRTRGHRQHLHRVRIDEIQLP
jgi:large subunit ribosomal protein L21